MPELTMPELTTRERALISAETMQCCAVEAERDALREALEVAQNETRKLRGIIETAARRIVQAQDADGER
ncbi:MAG TPA: hypothetical protein VIJ50_03770 [Solirubrobacteraceae bacterium]